MAALLSRWRLSWVGCRRRRSLKGALSAAVTLALTILLAAAPASSLDPAIKASGAPVSSLAGGHGDGLDPSPAAAESSADTGMIGGILLFCSGPAAGVEVSIQGRAEAVHSGPTGAFELRGLPPGTYALTVAHGQHGTFAGVQVLPGEVTDLGDINLTDLRTDPQHCGRCGRRCPPGASCTYGGCVCPAGRILCDDTCTDLADLDNCRACRNQCTAWPNTIPQCGAEDCVFQCVAGTADCDGRRLNGCETHIDRDPANCGACGRVCAPGLGCVDSRCQ